MSALTKLSVPGTDGNNPGTLMPKLQYRFRVTFINLGAGHSEEYMTSNVISVTKPSLTFDDVVIDTYNSKIKLAGKHDWAEVTIQLRDDVDNSVIKAVDSQLGRQLNMHDQSSPMAGSQYKFSVKIESLDGANGDAGTLDQWFLSGAYISNVQYGENNYSASEPSQISITVKYDNAIHSGASATAEGYMTDGEYGKQGTLSGAN
jgi:hypothetical protein